MKKRSNLIGGVFGHPISHWCQRGRKIRRARILPSMTKGEIVGQGCHWCQYGIVCDRKYSCDAWCCLILMFTLEDIPMCIGQLSQYEVNPLMKDIRSNMSRSSLIGEVFGHPICHWCQRGREIRRARILPSMTKGDIVNQGCHWCQYGIVENGKYSCDVALISCPHILMKP